jgi:4-carboxymuconolactone decarboxylase
MSEDDYKQGLARRTKLLGEAYVAKAMQQAPEFNQDFQRYVTEAVWGKVWSGGSLPERDRILVTLSMVCALGKGPEMRVHLRSALRNGISPEEIKSVFFHVGGYCGAPAALECFRAMQDVTAAMATEAALNKAP